MRKSTVVLTLGAISTIALIDGACKYFALTTFSDGSTRNTQSVIAFVLHKNPGITFDIPISIFILAPITLAILFVLAKKALELKKEQPLIALSIVSIIVGATDNFIDRIIHGFTTDYIMLFQTSIINLADILILVGAIIILVYYKNTPQKRPA
ncbi:MAG: signal peptidase II [Patescibacteria group bacterium]|jgi:lipoprotein signal peptidase